MGVVAPGKRIKHAPERNRWPQERGQIEPTYGYAIPDTLDGCCRRRAGRNLLRVAAEPEIVGRSIKPVPLNNSADFATHPFTLFPAREAVELSFIHWLDAGAPPKFNPGREKELRTGRPGFAVSRRERENGHLKE